MKPIEALKSARNTYICHQVNRVRLPDFEENRFVRRHITFHGRVQKVGFRIELAQMAESEEGRAMLKKLQGLRSSMDSLKKQQAGDPIGAAQRVEQYLGCDLMILDDLGTEMITAYSTSALYTLINTRLTRAKATIISTNCSNEELQKKYTPQILSRIEGEYQTLPFAGRDIRQIKKEREA